MSDPRPSHPPRYTTWDAKDSKYEIKGIQRSDTGLTGTSDTPLEPGRSYALRLQQAAAQTTPRSRFHVGRFWLWETVSIIVAAGLVAANIAILAHYDGQRVPEWPFSINLNTLIALLSTILRAALLVAVAEIIGQVKYTHFSKPRRLEDLNAFDRASRSVTGSIKLLFVAPGAFLAVLGAIVTILSLAIGPFTQQAIKSVSCPLYLRNATAAIPMAHYMPGRASVFRIGAGTWDIDVEMKGAMINGISNPTGNDSAIVATCKTGNCTFPVDPSGITHSSIAMCSACIDTTSLVSKNSTLQIANYTLPNDLWVESASGRVFLGVTIDYNLTWAESAFTDGFADIAKNAITNMSVLSFTQATCTQNSDGSLECPHNVTGYGGNTDYVATSCSLYACLKNMHAELHEGVLKERVVSTEPAAINWVEADIPEGSFESGANYTALKSPCTIDGVSYDKDQFDQIPRSAGQNFTGINVDGKNYSAPPECLYKMEKLYGMALNRFMSETMFTGQCTYDLSQGGQLYCGDAWWLSPLYNDLNATYSTISTQINQYATAVTNKFRTLGSDNDNSSTIESTWGQVIETTVCTSFDWRWLLLPGGLTAAAATLLVLMMVQNYHDPKQPVWKSSVLPLLYHGFGPAKPAMDLDEMKGQARYVQARFQAGDDAGFVNLTHVGGPPSNDLDLDTILAHRGDTKS